MKRLFCLITCLLLLCPVCLSGCKPSQPTSSSPSMIFNDTTDLSSLKTLAGERCDLSADDPAWQVSTSSGIGVRFPQAANDPDHYAISMSDEGVMCAYSSDYSASLYPDEEALSVMSDEEMETLVSDSRQATAYLFTIAVFPEDTASQYKPYYLELYSSAEELGSQNGNVYYFFHNEDFSGVTGFTDADAAAMREYVAAIDDIRGSICLFNPEEELGVSGSLCSFSAETLDGATVDQSVFADYDLTMVNVWATWCIWCVREMPELEALHQSLPENVNIISICTDADTEAELAKQTISENGVTFQTLIVNDQLSKCLLQSINAFPTTIFVDRDGNLVGAEQIGVPAGDSAAEAYLALINERLALLK